MSTGGRGTDRHDHRGTRKRPVKTHPVTDRPGDGHPGNGHARPVKTSPVRTQLVTVARFFFYDASAENYFRSLILYSFPPFKSPMSEHGQSRGLEYKFAAV